MTTKVNPSESAATPKFNTGIRKPAIIVDQTQKATQFLKQSAAYAANPALQQSVTAWEAAATTVDTSEQGIIKLRTSLIGLLAGRDLAVADWKRAAKSVLSNVDQIAKGSPKAINDMGFDITSRAVVPAANTSNDPPTGLHATYNRKTLALTLRWSSVPGHRGYNIQIGDGTPAGWGPTLQAPRCEYAPTGLAPGQHVSVRVAVQRKNGLSGWSDALAIVVR